MEERTVLRIALFITFALIAEFAFEIMHYRETPIRWLPALLLGLSILLFIYLTRVLCTMDRCRAHAYFSGIRIRWIEEKQDVRGHPSPY